MTAMYDKQEFFSTYFSKATEKSLFLKSFSKRFTSKKNEIRILDLGSHDGALVLKLLENLRAKFLSQHLMNVEIVAVEPSAAALEGFKRKRLPQGVRFQFEVKRAEEFLKENKCLFDWAIASHCLYWTRNLEETISLLKASTHTGVIVMRGKHGIFEVQSKFRHMLGNTQEHLYTAEEIEKCLQNKKILFEREDHQTEIHLPAYNSKEMLWLIAFFLQTTDEKLKKEEVEEILSFLKMKGEKMRHDVSFFWF